MFLQLKGKRKSTTQSSQKAKRLQKLLLLDLPTENPTEFIDASEELGYQKEFDTPTYETQKSAEPGNVDTNKDFHVVQEELTTAGGKVKLQRDIQTSIPTGSAANRSSTIKEDGQFNLKNQHIVLTEQLISDEKLGDQSSSYGPINDAFWDRLRKEISSVVRSNEKLESIAFEAAPVPESERVKNRKVPVYASGSSSSFGVIRF